MKPSIASALGGKVNTNLTVSYGATNGLFGPGTPQAAQSPQAKGRTWDFPSGYNLGNGPRQHTLITFQTLRNVADGYDLIRLCIETRKDQMEALKWSVAAKPDVEALPNQIARLGVINQWLQKPDRKRRWAQWLRAAVEDILVTDSLSIYVRRTRGGYLHSLRQIDGANIKLVIDDWGMVSDEPGSVGYQQIVKGITAVNYQDYSRASKEAWQDNKMPELCYAVRNVRNHSPYGFSPVEQVIATVSIGMARQSHQLGYFTEGNLPESLITTPEDWSTNEIAEFQAFFDNLLSGNMAERRRARFVAHGMQYTPMKTEPLFGPADEWLARVVCYAFSLTPQAFSPQMNRATAEAAQDNAEDEGLVPLRNFIAGLMNDFIDIEFNSPDLQFTWSDDDKLGAKVAREIVLKEFQAGLLSKNEARLATGRAATDDPEDDIAKPAALPALPAPAQKMSKADVRIDACHKPLSKADDFEGADPAWADHPLSPNRKLVKRAIKSATKTLEAGLAEAGQDAAIDIERRLNKLAKADGIDWDALLSGKWFGAAKQALEDIIVDMLIVAEDAAKVAASLISYDNFDKVNKRAVKLVKARGAELVSEITETTRDMLRKTIEQGLADNIGNKAIADLIEESYGFSPARAKVIATTEIANVNSESSLETYKEAKAEGLDVKKAWLLGPKPCQICKDNADAGAIDLEEPFPSGDQAPCAHPNCVCATTPVMGE